jgi:hypothetical protein
MKTFFSVLLLVGSASSFTARGQEQAQPVEAKSNTKYFGIQANQLVRQLLSIGNTSAATTPYLLTYSVNNANGVGWALGLGYRYARFSDGDAITPREVTESDFFFRIGLEKKKYWGKHWMAGWGVDVVLDRVSSRAETNFQPGGGSNIDTETLTRKAGLGPRFTLNYVINEKVIVGTEANYYYKGGKEKIDNPTVPGGKSESKERSFNLALPAVLYLILRF